MAKLKPMKNRILQNIKTAFRRMGIEISWYRGATPNRQSAHLSHLVASGTIEYPANLGLDHGCPMEPIMDAFVRHLCTSGCWIRTIFSPNEPVQLICFKYSDRNAIYDAVSKFSHGDVRVVFAARTNFSDHRVLKHFYFSDGENVLGSDRFAFDPWKSDGERIFTYNRNNLVSSVPRLYQERTPFAAGPSFLQGDKEFNVSYASSLRIPESADAIIPYPVDLVFTWVDGADPAWRSKRMAHSAAAPSHHGENNSDSRFREREELRYALRSVHCFGRFIRRIFIVTDDQAPHWLDASDNQISVISHRDIFPDTSYLPVFNSHAIEANIHRIPGLSEHFLYMNDDLMFWNKCRAADFFNFSGTAKIFLEDLPNVYGEPLASTPAWRAGALNVNRLMIERFGSTLYTHHLHVPFAMKKSVMEQIWRDYPAIMERTSRARFRSHEDVSPTSFFYPIYAYLTGQASLDSMPAVRTGLGVNGFQDVMVALLHDAATKCVCINDSEGDISILNGSVFSNSMRRKFARPAPWENDQ